MKGPTIRVMGGAACLAISCALWEATAGDAVRPLSAGRPAAEASTSAESDPPTVNCGAGNEQVRYYGVHEASLALRVCQEALKAARQCGAGACEIPGVEAVRHHPWDDLVREGHITGIDFDVNSNTQQVWGAEVFFGRIGTQELALSFIRAQDGLRVERWNIVLP